MSAKPSKAAMKILEIAEKAWPRSRYLKADDRTIFRLEREGLIAATSESGGHYYVTIMQAGRELLGPKAKAKEAIGNGRAKFGSEKRFKVYTAIRQPLIDSGISPSQAKALTQTIWSGVAKALGIPKI